VQDAGPRPPEGPGRCRGLLHEDTEVATAKIRPAATRVEDDPLVVADGLARGRSKRGDHGRDQHGPGASHHGSVRRSRPQSPGLGPGLAAGLAACPANQPPPPRPQTVAINSKNNSQPGTKHRPGRSRPRPSGPLGPANSDTSIRTRRPFMRLVYRRRRDLAISPIGRLCTRVVGRPRWPSVAAMHSRHVIR